MKRVALVGVATMLWCGRAAVAQTPLAGAALLDEPAADAVWYSTGHGSFIRPATGRQLLLRHPNITVRSPFRRYLLLRFFESSGYPLPFDSVGLQAVTVLIDGQRAWDFSRATIERHEVHHGWAVLLPLGDTEIVSSAGRSKTVEFRVRTTRRVSGAERDTSGGFWSTTYRVGFEHPPKRLRVGMPIGLVGYRPESGGSLLGLFPATLAVSYRLVQAGDSYVDLAAAWLPGAVRQQDNAVFVTVLNGGGFLDFGGWAYLGAAWVSDHRTGRPDPGAMVIGGIGPTLIVRLANLFGL